jgi:hypothetical protein
MVSTGYSGHPAEDGIQFNVVVAADSTIEPVSLRPFSSSQSL